MNGPESGNSEDRNNRPGPGNPRPSRPELGSQNLKNGKSGDRKPMDKGLGQQNLLAGEPGAQNLMDGQLESDGHQARLPEFNKWWAIADVAKTDVAKRDIYTCCGHGHDTCHSYKKGPWTLKTPTSEPELDLDQVWKSLRQTENANKYWTHGYGHILL